MAIISCSIKLGLLHYQMKNAGFITRVAFINELPDKGSGAKFLAVMIYQHRDKLYRTRDDLIAFLTEGK